MEYGIFNVPMPGAKIVKFIFIVLIIVLISILIFIAAWGICHKTLNKDELTDLSTLSQEQLKDGYPIKGKIDLAFDAFAEEYETTEGDYLHDKTTKLYYIVPVYSVDNEGLLNFNYVLAYESEPKYFDKMDAILTQTYSDTEELTELDIESGLIKDMPDELIGFYNGWRNDKKFYENGSFIDWCVEYNIFGTSDTNIIKEKITPYMIYDSSGSLDIVWVLLPIAGVLLIVMLCLIVIFKKTTKTNDSSTDKAYVSPPDIHS